MNVVDYERLGKFVYNENKRLHSYDGNPSIVYKTGARAWNVHDDVQRFPEDGRSHLDIIESKSQN